MTIYSYLTPFIFEEEKSDWHCSSVDMSSEYVVRVDECIRVCAYNFMGGYKKDEYNSYCLMSYRSFEKDGTVKDMDYCVQGYENLLDNFRMYYGAVEDDDTLLLQPLTNNNIDNPNVDNFLFINYPPCLNVTTSS